MENEILNYFYDVENSKFIEKLSNANEAKHCQEFDAVEGSASQKLERWIQNINSKSLTNSHYKVSIIRGFFLIANARSA